MTTEEEKKMMYRRHADDLRAEADKHDANAVLNAKEAARLRKAADEYDEMING